MWSQRIFLLISRSDSGGANFLGQVWDAVREWLESGDFQLEGIPRRELQVSATS